MSVYRQEALEHRAQGNAEGEVLRLDRSLTRRAYALVALAAIAGFLFLSLVSVDEYAGGPAVVHVEGRRLVATAAPGVVKQVHVQSGQRVEAGAILVQLDDEAQAKELARAEAELDRQMVQMLLDPSNVAVRQLITSLREKKEEAANAVAMRTYRADVIGYVSDLRVREGQHVAEGDLLVTVSPNGNSERSLVCVVSADYLPMLRKGLKMRFELDGFRYEYSDLQVHDVSEEAIGPNEVKRLLGGERSDAVSLDGGAKVMVTARLRAANFVSDGHSYGYFDGLTGKAEILVRRESLIVTLIPAFRKILP